MGFVCLDLGIETRTGRQGRSLYRPDHPPPHFYSLARPQSSLALGRAPSPKGGVARRCQQGPCEVAPAAPGTAVPQLQTSEQSTSVRGSSSSRPALPSQSVTNGLRIRPPSCVPPTPNFTTETTNPPWLRLPLAPPPLPHPQPAGCKRSVRALPSESPPPGPHRSHATSLLLVWGTGDPPAAVLFTGITAAASWTKALPSWRLQSREEGQCSVANSSG